MVLLACISTGYGLQSQIPNDAPLSSLISSAKSHLANGSPRDALLYFDAAISRDPTNYITIFQRGAAYLSLGKNSLASEDFDRVLKLNPEFEGARLQRARLRSRRADWAGALDDLEKAGKKSSTQYQELKIARDAALSSQDAEKKGDWDTCINQANVAISKASEAVTLRQTRAHCRFEKGEAEEGINDLVKVSHISPALVEPHLQMSTVLFYALGDVDRGVTQIRRCLHFDPDSKACSGLFRRQKQLVKRLDSLRELIDKQKFPNAVNLLVGASGQKGLIDDVKEDIQKAREAGFIYPATPTKLYNFLVESACEAYRQQSHVSKKALPYCSESLELDAHSLAGLLYKAQIAIGEDRFEDAINTLNSAKDYHPDSKEISTLLQRARVLLKRSKQKDYYKVLGVSRDADERTIKRAYRQLTKQYHPDKATARGIPREETEKKMATINEAYEVLSNPELKARFDNGDDPNDPQSQGGSPFQGSPFGHGGGGQHFFFQQGGPQFKFSGQGFNFPGGFPFR